MSHNALPPSDAGSLSSPLPPQVRARFLSAWRAALAGAPPPAPDDFLADLPEPLRAAGQTELRGLDAWMRDLLYAPNEATVTHQPTAPRGGSASSDGPVARDTVGPDPHASTLPPGRPSGQGPAVTTDMTLPGYELLGELGRGGMGVVYKARQVKADRIVALKVMRGPDREGGARERFDAEAKAAARLQHPNVAQVFEVGEVEGLPYFTLEYIDGGTLAQKAARDLLPPGAAAALLATLARAVQYAHQQGVIHRDLKPSNVLLTRDGVPKVADFGLAKRLEEADSSRTRAGTVVGTPSYMAPEQARGEIDRVGPAADVYALGAILYELLVGRPPFKGANVWETLEQVQNVEPIAPSTLQPTVPRDLETICLKCLQKEPGKRYASAQELADDLQRYLSGEPIQARPIGAAERLWRWGKRNPRVASLTAAVLLLLGTVAVVASAAAYRINEGRKQTAQQKEIAEKRLALYRGAVDRFVTDVPHTLRNVPFAGQARDEVLGLVRDLLQEAQGQAEDEGVTARGLISALVREGEVLQARKEYAAAEEKYQEARLRAEAARESETQQMDKAAGNLAVVLTRLGELNYLLARQGKKPPEAVTRPLEEALLLRQQIVTAPQTGEIPPAEAKASLGTIRTTLARALRDLAKDHEKALRYARQGEASLREAMASNELSPRQQEQARMNAGNAALEAGRAAFELGRADEGRGHFEQAIKDFEELVRDSPRNTTHLLNLRIAAAEYGDLLLLRLRKPDEARARYEVAVAQMRALTLPPEMVDFQQGGLALDYYRLATAALKMGNRPTARTYYERCLELRAAHVRDLEESEVGRKTPAVLTGPRINLMLAQARCGRHVEAAAMAARLFKAASGQKPGPARANLAMQAACGYALSADAPEAGDRRADYLSRAWEALHLAVASGYNNREFLERDPDLDPLRGDSRFRSLLEKVPPRAP